MAQLKWYFEDFEPGRTIPVGIRTVDQDEILTTDEVAKLLKILGEP